MARLVTEVLAPAPMVALLLLAVAWHSASTIDEAAKWAVVAVVFASLVPLGYILRGVRRHQLSDRHVGVRSQRPRLLLVGLGSVLAALVVLTAWGAPREMVALVAAMAVGLVPSMLVTLVWKISLHVAGVANTVVILGVVFGSAFFVLAPLVMLVGWARVELGDHTPAQVFAGALLGASVCPLVFSFLR